jgi:hypothetical protein
MTAFAPADPLTDDDVATFWRDGYLVVPHLATGEEVRRMRGIYDDLFARRAGREEGMQFDLAGADGEDTPAALPQILLPSTYAPELLGTDVRVRALALARQLLGPDAVDTGDHAINKPPRSTAATPWHQDEAYWDPGKHYRSLSVWVPLQEATLDNGCMQFLPGSHQHEVMPHQPIGGDVRVHGLEFAESVDTSAAVACPLPAGGATVHFCRTFHFTGANGTDEPRRAYVMSFGVPPEARAEPRSFPWLEHRRTARAVRAAAVGETREPGA